MGVFLGVQRFNGTIFTSGLIWILIGSHFIVRSLPSSLNTWSNSLIILASFDRASRLLRMSIGCEVVDTAAALISIFGKELLITPRF